MKIQIENVTKIEIHDRENDVLDRNFWSTDIVIRTHEGSYRIELAQPNDADSGRTLVTRTSYPVKKQAEKQAKTPEDIPEIPLPTFIKCK